MAKKGLHLRYTFKNTVFFFHVNETNFLDKKMMLNCMYFHVCGGVGDMCGEELKQSSLCGLHMHFKVGP